MNITNNLKSVIAYVCSMLGFLYDWVNCKLGVYRTYLIHDLDTFKVFVSCILSNTLLFGCGRTVDFDPFKLDDVDWSSIDPSSVSVPSNGIVIVKFITQPVGIQLDVTVPDYVVCKRDDLLTVKSLIEKTWRCKIQCSSKV